MPKYNIALFDMDGTIADTDEVILRTMYALYDLYRDGNRTPDEKIYYFSGPHVSETMKTEFPNREVPFMVSEFNRISRQLYPKYMKEYPYCREALLKLKEAGVKLGVVTNKATKYAYYCLEQLHLDDVFDYLIGYDDVKNGKPDKEGIMKCLEHFQAHDLKKAIYVGDNKVDLDSANNAGIDCCLVKWSPRVLPKDIKPAYMIKDYRELEKVILDE